MSGPIFDKKQYELRGKLPIVTGAEQNQALNSVIDRVNSQIDWNAQLLGFNGTNYWGKRDPRNDGLYVWQGLPSTVSEKRAVQVGTFGIYNKDLDYSQRPAPFNRSDVRASADLTFDVYEKEGRVVIVPLGQPKDLLYEKTPRLIVGGEYIFSSIVEAKASGDHQDSLLVTQDLDRGITSVRIIDSQSDALLVSIPGSDAEPAIFFFEEWDDVSDWKSERLLNQFLGVWGNKGNHVSSHFLFDALDIHGFDEREGLSLDNILRTITLRDLLLLIGLKPGPATPYDTAHLNFMVEGCGDHYNPTTSLETKIVSIQTQDLRDVLTEDGLRISLDDGECFREPPPPIRFLVDGPISFASAIDNGSIDDPQPILDTLNNGEFPQITPADATVSDGGVFTVDNTELTAESGEVICYDDASELRKPCFQLPDPEFGQCETPNFRLSLRQEFADDPAGISTDPGPEASVALGANGFRGLDPISGLINNGEYDRAPAQFFLDGGDFDNAVSPNNSVSEGAYDRDPLGGNAEPLPEDFYERRIEGFDLAADLNGGEGPVIMSDVGVENEVVLIASGTSDDGYDGDIIAFDGLALESVSFEYEAKTTYGEVRFPCLEWIFDPTLDNSTYSPVPDGGAWMTADDGEYDERRDLGFVPFASQLSVDCLGGQFRGGFLAFDDGEYDEAVQPYCDSSESALCALADGGILGPENPGPNAICAQECGDIDNGAYFYGKIPYSGPISIDGLGSVNIERDCVFYDGENYDRVVSPENTCIYYDNFFVGEARDELCRLDDQEYDDGPALFQVDQGEYFDGFVSPVCTPCGEALPPPQCYLDNGSIDGQAPTFTEDEGFFDKGPIECIPCDPEPQLPIPCPVEPLRVRLDQIIFSSPAWRMRPSIINSKTPLRLWKSQVLNVQDLDSPSAFKNGLAADHNTGPNPENSFRHFTRLPAEYARNSKFWNRTEASLSNLSSFSSTTKPISSLKDPLNIILPIYDDSYAVPIRNKKDSEIFYAEDYLCSGTSDLETDDQSGFLSSSITFEDGRKSKPFTAAAVTNYDAYELRVLNEDGSRSGFYLKWVEGPHLLTGHLQTDINSGALRYATRGELGLLDSSVYEAPNIDFPDGSSEAVFSNYVVSYAYFSADLSAADEPVFDPTVLSNHRREILLREEFAVGSLATGSREKILTEDFDVINVFEEGLIESLEIPTRTNYIYNE